MGSIFVDRVRPATASAPGFLAGIEPDHSGETVVRNHNAWAGGAGEPKAADGHDAPKLGDDGLHDHRRAERRYHDARDH